jgi:catalase-peroxidase
MTLLIGGLRVLDANVGQSKHGVFTKRLSTLIDDFFATRATSWQRHAR